MTPLDPHDPFGPRLGPDDSLLDHEPVLVILGGVTALVDLGLVAARSLDWIALTDAQLGAVLAFVTALTGLAAATVRSMVWSPAGHAAAIDASGTAAEGHPYPPKAGG